MVWRTLLSVTAKNLINQIAALIAEGNTISESYSDGDVLQLRVRI
jgi:hypothetical protein